MTPTSRSWPDSCWDWPARWLWPALSCCCHPRATPVLEVDADLTDTVLPARLAERRRSGRAGRLRELLGEVPVLRIHVEQRAERHAVQLAADRLDLVGLRVRRPEVRQLLRRVGGVLVEIGQAAAGVRQVD